MHTVRFIHTGETCQVETGETLLHAADTLAEKGLLPRQLRGCNNGVCDICRLKVVEGIGNLFHSTSGKPLHGEKVPACIAEIRGDVTIEERLSQ